MNILLIGGEGSLINKLIVKFRKERHRVFLVTGNRYRNAYYEKVYERFDFPYDGESMVEIFRSVKPDLTIFMGSQDTNFDWKSLQQDSVRYNASLTNILMSYAMLGKGRFLYLSGADMYSGDYAEPITEETEVRTTDFYRSIMQKAETLCLSYRDTRELDVVALRLDRVWTVPQNADDVKNICARMCLQAMEDGRIVYRPNASFTWIYETDVVEYMYRIAVAKEHRSDLYQITSGRPMSEEKLAMSIQKYMDAAGTEIALEAGDPVAERNNLSNRRFTDEFGVNFYCDPEGVVGQIVGYMTKNRDVFLYSEDKKPGLFKRIMDKAGWLIRSLVPYLENILCFIAFFLLNRFASGSEFLFRLDIYLLYVLVIALVHGQRQATLAALLATLGYVFLGSDLRSGFEIMVDSGTYVWIAQLFIVGMVVGYQRDRYHLLNSERKEEKEFLAGKIEDMVDINQINVRVKDSLEMQIVNQSDSIGKIYSITSSLEQYMPEEVFFQAADVLKRIFNARQVSIYTVDARSYARLYTATSPEARKLGNSLRLEDMGRMYDDIRGGKVFINREMDPGYPMMAAAVMGEENMKAILMIWDLPWDAMTLSTANLLAVTAALIRDAVLRAERYLKALEDERYSSGYGALEAEAFENLYRVYEKARTAQLTEFSVLRLRKTGTLREQIGREVMRYLRQSDYVGVVDGELYILLTNTGADNVGYVVNRLLTQGYQTDVVEVLPG